MVPPFSPHFSELFETQHGVFWTPSKNIFFCLPPKTWSKSGKIEEKGPILDQIGPISSEKSNEPKSYFFVENVFVKINVAGRVRPIAFLAELEPF